MTPSPPAAPGRARSLRPALLVAAAVGGLLLIAVPWIEPPLPMPLPEVIEPDSPALGQVRAAAVAVDRAAAAGDVGGLRERVTASMWAELDERLRAAGKPMGSAAVRELGLIAGGLDGLALQRGETRGDGAVTVFLGERPALSGAGSARRVLTALRWHWDGRSLQLDGRWTRVLGVGEDAGAAARAWIAELHAPAGGD